MGWCYQCLLQTVFTQSKKSAVIGAVKVAKKQGMIAAYLNVAAIIAACVVACLVLGLVLGLYGPVYVQEQFCNDYRNGKFYRFNNNYNYNYYGYNDNFDDICRYS